MKSVAHFNTYLSARLIGILMRVHMHMYKSEIDFAKGFSALFALSLSRRLCGEHYVRPFNRDHYMLPQSQRSGVTQMEAPLSYKMTVNALFGVLITGVICLIAFFLYSDISSLSEGENAGNSGSFMLLSILVSFLWFITFASLWIDHVQLNYLAFPWYHIFRLFGPDIVAIAIGFMLNGGLIGALIAKLKHKKTLLGVSTDG